MGNCIRIVLYTDILFNLLSSLRKPTRYSTVFAEIYL